MMVRSTAVLLSLTAWFFLSNHCALGVIGSTAEAVPEAGGCPMHAAPAKKKPAPKLPCCQEIRAVVAKEVTNAIPFPLRLVGPCNYVTRALELPPQATIENAGFDTGPPGRSSFAELVLQESMLAHAPPVS